MEYTTGSFLNSSQPQRQEQPPLCYKILLNSSEPETFVRLERNGKGGGKRASFHKVREIYIDNENRIQAGFKPGGDNDKSGRPYQYAIIGRLQVIGEPTN